MKLLKSAPLPFQGQKRMWVRYLPELYSNIQNPEDYIFIDVFGGSGLLAYNTKQIFPNAEVVYNDFDNYIDWFRPERLQAMAGLQSKLLEIIDNNGMDRKGKFPKECNSQIKDAIRSVPKDLIITPILKGWILYSSQATRKHSLESILSYEHFYHRVSRKVVAAVPGYFDGLIVERLDFKELIRKYEHSGKKLFLICDPPYVNTCCGNYEATFSKEDFKVLVEFCKIYSFCLFGNEKNNFKDFILQYNSNNLYSEFKNIKLLAEYKTVLSNGGAKSEEYCYYLVR